MKKLSKISLTELSKNSLDKIQQTAIKGGGGGYCICAYICGSMCNCIPNDKIDIFAVSDFVTEVETIWDGLFTKLDVL